MAEYRYWYACMRLKKIIFNEKDNIKIQVFTLDDEKFVISQKEYSVLHSLLALSCFFIFSIPYQQRFKTTF